jgi:hypothetical protein
MAHDDLADFVLELLEGRAELLARLADFGGSFEDRLLGD